MFRIIRDRGPAQYTNVICFNAGQQGLYPIDFKDKLFPVVALEKFIEISGTVAVGVWGVEQLSTLFTSLKQKDIRMNKLRKAAIIAITALALAPFTGEAREHQPLLRWRIEVPA